MKKLIAFVLILAVLLPVSSLAADNLFTGCYVHTEYLTTGCPSFTFICLTEDYKCYFFIQAFRENELGLGRSYIGTWSIEDGYLVAKTGDNTTTRLLFDDDYNIAYNPDTLQFYIHTSTMIDRIMDELLK